MEDSNCEQKKDKDFFSHHHCPDRGIHGPWHGRIIRVSVYEEDLDQMYRAAADPGRDPGSGLRRTGRN